VGMLADSAHQKGRGLAWLLSCDCQLSAPAIRNIIWQYTDHNMHNHLLHYLPNCARKFLQPRQSKPDCSKFTTSEHVLSRIRSCHPKSAGFKTSSTMLGRSNFLGRDCFVTSELTMHRDNSLTISGYRFDITQDETALPERNN